MVEALIHTQLSSVTLRYMADGNTSLYLKFTNAESFRSIGIIMVEMLLTARHTDDNSMAVAHCCPHTVHCSRNFTINIKLYLIDKIYEAYWFRDAPTV